MAGQPYVELEDAPPRSRRAGPARGAARWWRSRTGRSRRSRWASTDRRRRARGAHRGVPAARAAVGAARPGADPVRSAGRRPRGAARGPRRARRRARARARRGAARAADGGPAPGPRAGLDRRPGRVGRHAAASAGGAAVPTSCRLAAGRPGRPARAPSSALLEQSPGRRAFAVVTGEPGIGKSRLAAELAATACERGRDGAGRTVLPGRRRTAALAVAAGARASSAHDCPRGADPTARTRPARFRAWEPIARTVLGAAAERHCWSCSTTCTGPTSRPCGCCGCSPRPQSRPAAGGRDLARPAGADRALAEVAETLARRHALRLELTRPHRRRGRRMVAAVAATRRRPTSEADALRGAPTATRSSSSSTPGSRASGGDLAALLGEAHPRPRSPTCSPGGSRGSRGHGAALRWPRVLGREFDLRRWPRVAGTDEDDVLDRLDPALEAGLVREDGVDRFLFAHALVRDTATPRSRAPGARRLHARVAEVLAGAARPRERGGAALAGGRSGVRRPRLARRASRGRGGPRAPRLRRGGGPAPRRRRGPRVDADATDEDRFELLLDLARAHLLTDNLIDRGSSCTARSRSTERSSDLIVRSTLSACWPRRRCGSRDLRPGRRGASWASSAGLLDRLPPGDGR